MDNNIGFRFKKNISHQDILVTTIALLLMAIGLIVPMGWHNYHLLFNAQMLFSGMAYNTAVCFFLSGIGLLALNLRKRPIVFISGCAILIIGCVRLGELIFTTDNIPQIPYSFVEVVQQKSALMNPATAFNFVLSAISLLISSASKPQKFNQSSIWVMFISLVIIACTLVAFYDNAITKLLSITWLKIKIAPLTAGGFILFSCSIIAQLQTTARQSFNRFSVFKRLVIGFGFLSTLFIGVGTIAYMQIHGVSVITQELHQNPLQINYAALRIKTTISQLNRKLKDIAIKPQLGADLNAVNLLDQAYHSLQTEFQLIRQREPTLISEIQEFNSLFIQWRDFILISEKLLKQGDTSAFRERTLNQTQLDSIAMETFADQLIQKTQSRMQELNLSILKTERDARSLLLISVTGLLSMGLLVAFLITRSLTNQLQKIRHAMLEIADGNTDIAIPYRDYPEEIGDMAKTLAVFAQNAAKRKRIELRMSKIIEATPNGILMINQNGLIEVFNQQAERIFGYPREQILGKTIEQLIPGRMTGNHPQFRQDFFNNPTPRAMGAGRDLFGLRLDGSEFPLEIGLAPIETEEGLKVLASIVDISERKKSEQTLKEHQVELEKSNTRLAQTNKELETFAYVASHDLKSPLRGIAQLSSWIEEDLEEKDFSNIDNHTRMLRNRIHRMEKLLDDLLIFYRAGKSDGTLEKIDISQLATEVFEIQNNKTGLTLELSDNLPRLTTLSTPFEQVLRNLFSNAIKHHDKNEGKIQLSCLELNSEYYEFKICDDGPGIPKQFQERIFGMFQTLKSRDEMEGSGMGLALIKKIVENYGGKISVDSNGRGCCFRFTWPKNIKGKIDHD